MGVVGVVGVVGAKGGRRVVGVGALLIHQGASLAEGARRGKRRDEGAPSEKAPGDLALRKQPNSGGGDGRGRRGWKGKRALASCTSS